GFRRRLRRLSWQSAASAQRQGQEQRGPHSCLLLHKHTLLKSATVGIFQNQTQHTPAPSNLAENGQSLYKLYTHLKNCQFHFSTADCKVSLLVKLEFR